MQTKLLRNLTPLLKSITTLFESGMAQLTAAHWPNERTLAFWTHSSSSTDTYGTYAPDTGSQMHYGLHPAMFSGKDSLLATRLPAPEGWKAELA